MLANFGGLFLGPAALAEGLAMTAEDFQAFSEALVKVRAPTITDSLEGKRRSFFRGRERESDLNEIVHFASCLMS